MQRVSSTLWALVVICSLVLAVPVRRPEKHEEKVEEHGEEWEQQLEYSRYLKEVVQTLESDSEFRKKLETADADDIKSGKISKELNYVGNNVRTKLDELKRQELERLRHLATQEHEREIGVDRRRLKVPAHIDYKNPVKFEVEDLKKLIMQTTKELEEVDQQKRKEFKRYEMDKDYKYNQEIKGMDEEHRKEAQEKHDANIKKHKDHPKLHEPGTKQQYQEVWEEEDHLDREDFNPVTFFKLHDLDGNNHWDEYEVKALFLKELDKMYNSNATEDDIREREEEMEKMKVHVFQENDKNRDGLISFKEFQDQSQQNEFERDNGWEGIDEQRQYTNEEYESYERARDAEIKRLVDSGQIPPQPVVPVGVNPPNPSPMSGQQAVAPGQQQQPVAGQPLHQQAPQYQPVENQLQQQGQHTGNQPSPGLPVGGNQIHQQQQAPSFNQQQQQQPNVNNAPAGQNINVVHG